MCILHKNLSLQQIFQSILDAEVHIVLMLINTLGNEPNFISAKSTSIRYYEQIHVTLNYSSCNVNLFYSDGSDVEVVRAIVFHTEFLPKTDLIR